VFEHPFDDGFSAFGISVLDEDFEEFVVVVVGGGGPLGGDGSDG